MRSHLTATELAMTIQAELEAVATQVQDAQARMRLLVAASLVTTLADRDTTDEHAEARTDQELSVAERLLPQTRHGSAHLRGPEGAEWHYRNLSRELSETAESIVERGTADHEGLLDLLEHRVGNELRPLAHGLRLR